MAQALGNKTSHRPHDSQTSNPTQQAEIRSADQGVQYAPAGGGGNNSVMQSWAAPATPAVDPFMKAFMERQEAERAANTARANSMFDTLMAQSKQSLAVDRNNPVIRAQADANAANETRAMRDHLADMAESAGPTANLLGEERLAAERLGQRTGGFEAELIGRELQALRDEKAQALQMMGQFLSQDKAEALQREIAVIDQRLQQQQLAQGDRSLDLDWRKALLNNDQFMTRMGLDRDRLGLDIEDRASYWDSVRRGIL